MKKSIIIISLLAVIILLDLYAFSSDKQDIVKDKHQYTVEGAADYSYSGGLKSGLPEGEGVIVFSNGDSYSGRFISGQFDGAGVFASDGWRFDGSFSNGSLHGPGAFTADDGSIFRGFWDKGVLVQ